MRFADPNNFFPSQSLIKFAQFLHRDTRSRSALPAQTRSNLAVADSPPKIASLSLKPINISARRLNKFVGLFDCRLQVLIERSQFPQLRNQRQKRFIWAFNLLLLPVFFYLIKSSCQRSKYDRQLRFFPRLRFVSRHISPEQNYTVATVFVAERKHSRTLNVESLCSFAPFSGSVGRSQIRDFHRLKLNHHLFQQIPRVQSKPLFQKRQIAVRSHATFPEQSVSLSIVQPDPNQPPVKLCLQISESALQQHFHILLFSESLENLLQPRDLFV